MSRWLVTDKDWVPVLANMANMDYTQNAQVIAEMDNGQPIAVALFDLWNGYFMILHLWIKEGCRPSKCFYWAASDYPFAQAGVKKVFINPSSHNRRVLKLAKHMGFKLVARVPDFYADGEDALIHCITREEVTFLRRFTREPCYAMGVT